MFFIIIIDKLHHISIKFFFCADQRFNSPLEGKCQKRIFPGHIFIEFPDFLGLGSKEFCIILKTVSPEYK